MNLYRILIVDDEPHVVEALIRLLESQIDLPIDLYYAYNAPDAMKIIQKGKIDLLITDIQMPEMNGLQLAREVNKLWQNCKIVIFTAYPDFAYAYEAFRNNAVSYILKTEEDSYIIHTIKNALESIGQEIISKQALAYTELSKPVPVNHIRRQQFFYLLNQNGLSQEECQKLMTLLGLSPAAKQYYLMFALIKPNFFRQLSANTYPRCYEVLKQLLDEMVRDIFDCHIFEVDDSGRVIGLLQLDRSDNQTRQADEIQPLQWFSGILETVQNAFEMATHLEVSFIFSTGISDIRRLPSVLEEGKRYLETLSANTTSYIYKYDPISRESGGIALPKPAVQNAEACQALSDALEGYDSEAFFQLLEELCTVIEKGGSWQDHAILEQYYSIVLVIISYARKHRLNSQMEFHIQLDELFHPWHFHTWKECTDNLIKLSQILFVLIEAKQNTLVQNTVLFMRNYIDSHLTEDVSLIQLSAVTGYNASYLSWLFHQQTGEPLYQYINRKKIELLDNLLKNVNLSIEDISAKMGFHSRPYFNQFVKKNVGMTPKNYRVKLLST